MDLQEFCSNATRRVVITRRSLIVSALVCALVSGCSFRKIAVNKLGDALAAGGTTFASDDDPELVKAAVPFSLKLMESLLAENPKHAGLLFATASGFTQYAYAFVQQDADEMEDTDLSAATAMRARARKLYLRARNYGLRGLEASRFYEEAARESEKNRGDHKDRRRALALLDRRFLGGGDLEFQGRPGFDCRRAGRGSDD
jgi:hypothetical protein